MVGQRVEEFLGSFNLESEDVPKVLGFFVAAKYATLAAGIAIGLRYQPLRRVVLARSLVLRSSPWGQQQRSRVLEALETAKKYHQRQLGAPWAQQQRTRIREAFDRAKQFRQGQLSQRSDAMDAAKSQMRHVKANLRDAKGRLKHAGQTLLLNKQVALQQQKLSRARQSWHGWISRKYWNLADGLATAAGNNNLFQMLSRNLGLMPRTLAVGTAEGVLLAKLALPVTAPLTLALAVLIFRRPGTSGATSAQECTETLVE